MLWNIHRNFRVFRLLVCLTYQYIPLSWSHLHPGLGRNVGEPIVPCKWQVTAISLTVFVPVGMSIHFAVENGIVGLWLLPSTTPSSDHHPAIVPWTSFVHAFDDKAAAISGFWIDSKEITRLRSDVRPRCVFQLVNIEPVHVVFSFCVEDQLLHWISTLIKDNSCLLK